MTYTPWGPSQTSERLADGIMDYTTASHGGIHLTADRIAQLAAVLGVEPTAVGQWFEEDCDWAIPYLVFHCDDTRPDGVRQEDGAIRALAHWHPDIAERLQLDVLTITNEAWRERFDRADHRVRCAMCRQIAGVHA